MALTSYLWDTCVLYRWLNGIPNEYVDHIGKFLEDLESKKCEIFVSTITLAEIAPSRMGNSGLSPVQVLRSISKSFIMIDTMPDIMSLAGHLRDQKYRPVDGPDRLAFPRPLGLGDAIHLATAVALREEFGVQNLKFHTFDQGKKPDAESGKKSVPMLGFDSWCRDCGLDEEVQKVIAIPKTKPIHDNCPLPKVPKTASRHPASNGGSSSPDPIAN